MKTLVLAIGNSGRQDDGLGWAFGEALEKDGQFEGEVHYRYQLQVEDADLVTTADRVVFVDAFKDPLPDGFQWKKIAPNADFEFTTHALSPEAVLFFCEQLYGRVPDAYCMLISGEAWELEIGLTERGKKNLELALMFWVHPSPLIPHS
jgi:hydrogenase maturation protease